MTPAGLPKGDRADVRPFKSAVAKRLRAARGGVLKLSPLLFTINEPGPALTRLVNGTLRLFDPEAAHRMGRSASNLHSTMRIGDPAQGSNPAGTPMEMLAAPIGLFAPVQIGRCPVGRARTEGEPTQLPIFPCLSQANPRQRDDRCFWALALVNVPRSV